MAEPESPDVVDDVLDQLVRDGEDKVELLSQAHFEKALLDLLASIAAHQPEPDEKTKRQPATTFVLLEAMSNRAPSPKINRLACPLGWARAESDTNGDLSLRRI